jgi:hypothetical protein
MIMRADRLWLEEVESRLPLHALEYYWDEFEPVLLCYDTARGKETSLGLESADFVVGSRKRCVGRFEDDRYVPCPFRAEVTKFSQCDKCAAEVFIEDQECIFDPKCEGEKCDNEFCKRPHVLYLAFYDTLPKVGMSSTRRVERRLVEQGADAFAIIGTFPNRYRAREAEKSLSAELELPQWYRQQTILANFSRPLDIAGMEAKYSQLKAAISSRGGYAVESLRMLSGYPLELPLPGVPNLQETPGMHMGRLLGVKGKWLLYESRGLKALNMSDLVGRFMSRGLP